MTRLTIDSTLRSARGAILFGRGAAVHRLQATAPIESRADWGDAAPAPAMAALDARTRSSLGEYWLRAGSKKHAEVARFSMLVIDLLAIGAPPALIRGAQLIMGDKIDHARNCFGLASAYASRPLGPGRLDTAGASSSPIFEDVLDRIVQDGCIAQTLASLEAQEALTWVTEPAIEGVLARLAEDAARHTRWAWQMLRWGIAQATTSQRATVLFHLETALAGAPSACRAAGDPANAEIARSHGVLTGAARRDLVSRGLVEVIEPCARVLFELVDQPAHRLGYLA